MDIVPRPDSLTITGRFQSARPVPGDPRYGTWSTYVREHEGILQYGARLTPDAAPWRSLFSALDEAGSLLSDDPVTPEVEADAILACCWRYGSYAHVLTAGEFYPPFRQDPSLSRIDDSEMKRINLEFSSGLAHWLAQRAGEPATVRRRVRAALLHLPLSRRKQATMSIEEYLDIEPLGADLRAILSEHPAPPAWSKKLTTREEANHVVVWAYRNGPIEDVHAGTWSFASEVPGFKRLYAEDVACVSRFAIPRLARYLAVRDRLDPMLCDMLLRAWTFGSATGWTVDEETSSVRFPGLPQLGPLDGRLRWLANRWPGAYGAIAQSQES